MTFDIDSDGRYYSTFVNADVRKGVLNCSHEITIYFKIRKNGNIYAIHADEINADGWVDWDKYDFMEPRNIKIIDALKKYVNQNLEEIRDIERRQRESNCFRA